MGIEGSDGFQGKRREDPLLVVAEKEYKGGDYRSLTIN